MGLLVHFLGGEPADEDGRAVPDDLQHLSGRDLGDVDLEVGVPVVPGPAVEPADDCHCVEPGEVGHRGVVDCAEHVGLGPPDLGLVLVVDPVLVEPVVEGGLEVDVVAEVAGTGGGGEELRLVGDGVVDVELLGGALIVVRNETEASPVPCLTPKVLCSRPTAERITLVDSMLIFYVIIFR